MAHEFDLFLLLDQRAAQVYPAQGHGTPPCPRDGLGDTLGRAGMQPWNLKRSREDIWGVVALVCTLDETRFTAECWHLSLLQPPKALPQFPLSARSFSLCSGRGSGEGGCCPGSVSPGGWSLPARGSCCRPGQAGSSGALCPAAAPQTGRGASPAGSGRGSCSGAAPRSQAVPSGSSCCREGSWLPVARPWRAGSSTRRLSRISR